MRACAICAARPAQGCHSAGDPPCGPSSRVWRRFCEIQFFTPNQHPLKGPKSGHGAVDKHFSNLAICSRFGRVNPTSHMKSSSVLSGVPYFEKLGAGRAARHRPLGGHQGGTPTPPVFPWDLPGKVFPWVLLRAPCVVQHTAEPQGPTRTRWGMAPVAVCGLCSAFG